MKCGAIVVNADKLTYAANLRSLDGIAGQPAVCPSRRPTSAIGRRWTCSSIAYQPTGVIHLAAGKSRRSLDRRCAADFLQTNVQGTFHLLEAARRFSRSAWPAEQPDRNSASSMSRPTRSTARLEADGLCSTKDFALSAELALFRQQSGVGSFSTRVAQDLRPAGCGFQLLQQLRAPPIPGKACSAGYPERFRGQAAAGLRNRK